MENFVKFYSHLVLLRLFGVFSSILVYRAVIWNIFSHFGMLHLEKSGNPALNRFAKTLFSRIWNGMPTYLALSCWYVFIKKSKQSRFRNKEDYF
jgi:hypothetical protein